MHKTFNAIVNPVITKKTPDPGEIAVLVSSATDLDLLIERQVVADATRRSLFMSRHYLGTCPAGRVSLVGPIVGSPYAVMLLDTLVAWGVQRILFLGWCGSISAGVGIGDIVVPERAFIDEGTSRHYLVDKATVRLPAGVLSGRLTTALDRSGTPFHQGSVWTTDAIYRETEQQVKFFQDKGALAVEMEMSALFSAARFRGVDLCGLLVTSDLLFDMHWKPGFRDERFKAARHLAADAISRVLSDQG